MARLTAIRQSRLEELIATGQARPGKGNLADLPPPEPGHSLSAELEAMRADERY